MTVMDSTCIVCGVSFETTTRARAKTCSEECRRKKQHATNEASRKRAAERGCPPDKHGTAMGYTRYRCTCERCKEWSRQNQAQRRAKAREKRLAAVAGQLWIEFTDSSGSEGSARWGGASDADIDAVIDFVAERLGRQPDTVT